MLSAALITFSGLIVASQAAIFPTFPVAGSVCSPGADCQVQWTDNTAQPSAAQVGPTSLDLMRGDASNLTVVQAIGGVSDPSIAKAVTFKPDATLTPGSDYAIRFNSSSFTGAGGTVFSTFFSIGAPGSGSNAATSASNTTTGSATGSNSTTAASGSGSNFTSPGSAGGSSTAANSTGLPATPTGKSSAASNSTSGSSAKGANASSTSSSASGAKASASGGAQNSTSGAERVYGGVTVAMGALAASLLL